MRRNTTIHNATAHDVFVMPVLKVCSLLRTSPRFSELICAYIANVRVGGVYYVNDKPLILSGAHWLA